MTPRADGTRSDSSYAWWLSVAFTFFFATPTNQVPLKLAVLLPVLFVAPQNERRRRTNGLYFAIAMGLTALGAFLNLYDLLLNEKNWKMVNLYVTDVFVYALIGLRLSQLEAFPRILARSAQWSFTTINVLHASLIGASLSGAGEVLTPLREFISFKFGVSPEYGFWAYSSNLLVVQMFLAPFMIALFLLSPEKWPLARIAVFVAGVLVNAASLRLALVGVIVLSAACLLVAARRRRAPNASGPMLAALQAGFAVVVLLGLGSALEGIYFLKLDDKIGGTDLRYEQSLIWLEYWREAPLLGQGLSSVAVWLEDADGRPMLVSQGRLENQFGYELVPLKALAEIGVLGVLAYLSFVGVILLGLRRVIHGYRRRRDRSHLLATCEAARVGLLCYLLATCTNGYLISFSGMCPVFIAYALTWHCESRDASPASASSRLRIAGGMAEAKNRAA